MTSIAVVGSVNLDLVATVDDLPAPGETVTGATLARFPGGKGANQALAAQRLGASVTLVAAVGADAEADLALELAQDGALVMQLTEAFGGINYMTDAQREFIENWEVESYRQQQVS